jgi:hypothetical protein
VDFDAAGIVAIAAAALAVVALICCLFLARRLRRLRATQQLITGEGGERTIAEHAGELDRRLAELGGDVTRSLEQLDGRDAELDRRLRGAITQVAVVRYDAMGEMTGRQSSSIALLDSRGNGVVLSSILHREQARLYVKPLIEGESEFDLSPEERQAFGDAMGRP